MIININALEKIFEINTEKYFPVHSHIILKCVKGKDKLFTILCMNQKIITIEEYISLRRQTANIEINEYLTKLLEIGLKYIVSASPVLLIDHGQEKIEKKKSKS